MSFYFLPSSNNGQLVLFESTEAFDWSHFKPLMVCKTYSRIYAVTDCRGVYRLHRGFTCSGKGAAYALRAMTTLCIPMECIGGDVYHILGNDSDGDGSICVVGDCMCLLWYKPCKKSWIIKRLQLI
jgi:hypothetical protein